MDLYKQILSYAPEMFVVASHYTYVVRLTHICTVILFRACTVVTHPEISQICHKGKVTVQPVRITNLVVSVMCCNVSTAHSLEYFGPVGYLIIVDKYFFVDKDMISPEL